MISVAGRREGGKVVLTNKNLVFALWRPPRQVVALRSIGEVEAAGDEIVLRSAGSELARFGIYEKAEREAWVRDIEGARALAERRGESVEEELSAVAPQATVEAGPVDFASQGRIGVLLFALGGAMMLFTYFWITRDYALGVATAGSWVQYAVAFIGLLMMGSGLHGIIRSATH